LFVAGALALLPLLPNVQREVASEAPPSYEFVGGRWFDGQKFVPGHFYTVGGLLTSKKPARVDRVIDLTGKYVVPPFGDAHSHNVDGFSAETSARIIRRYLEEGIFYVKNPTSLPRMTANLAGKINTRTSIDVVFSNGGLTATGGHPQGLFKRNLGLGIFKPEEGDGGMFHVVDNLADLERKWPSILAGKPDFIKTFLLYSEEYEKRKGDDAYFAWKGLDPSLLPEIVRRAHAAGLRVSTHVETATDFHNALVAGVDEINHTPGFRADPKLGLARYEISEADARLAARKGVFVVTTLGGLIDGIEHPDANSPDAKTRQALRDMIVHNLSILRRHGVRIALGSDIYRQTSLYEVMQLRQLKLFDNLTLLKMWCEETPATIFPRRKIGRLREGYEASFLVLGGDPLQDFDDVRKIELRVKQGETLTPQ
jgi:hypothetical protein